MCNESYLRTTVLPKFNCSNCKYYITNPEILVSETVGAYAAECSNLVHPLEDCILRGFEGHSDQPGLTNTINI